MKIILFKADPGTSALGVLDGESIISLEGFCNSFHDFFIQLSTQGEKSFLDTLQRAPSFPSNTVKLKAPFDYTANVFAVAANYKRHAAEMGVSIPRHPLIFNKLAQSIIGPGQDILLPPYSKQVDYEGELAVMIGQRAFNVNQEEAMHYVGGYTCFNDITARDRQWTMLGENRVIDWFSSKMMQNSTPLGPWIVLAGKTIDPHTLRLQTRINGQTVQDESTACMVFQIPALLEYISSRVVLNPGDIIATGTPYGVGGHNKKVILRQGDTVDVQIEEIGTLTNKCR